MDISLRKQFTREAFLKGYRVINNILHNPKGEIIRGSISNGKYRVFSLKIPKTRRSVRVPFHHLVAFEKFGEDFFQEEIDVRHLNGNPLDNSWDNIVIGTRRENTMDRCPLVRRIHSLKTSWHNRRFSDLEVVNIKTDRNLGFTYKELSLKYNVNKSTLSFLFNHALYFKYPSLEEAIEAITKEFLNLQTKQ